LLSKHSTVFIKTYGLGSLATVSFRGTGASHTKVQWNGVTLNSPMNGQIDFSLYPTFFFDNAEIHYGASGLVDGNGALGGSVLMNNTETYNKGFSGNIKQTAGSFGNYTSALGLNFSNKKWSSNTKLFYLTGKNDFDFTNSSEKDNPTSTQSNAEIKQYGVQQEIYRKFKNSSLGLRFWYFNSDRNLPHAMNTSDNDETQQDEALRTLIEWKGLHKNLQYKISSAIVKDQLIYNNQLANIYSLNKSLFTDNNIDTKIYINNNFIINSKININYQTAKADGYSKSHQRFNNSWLLSISKNYKRLSLDVMNRLIAVGDNFQPIAPSVGIKYQLLKNHNLLLKANAGTNYNYPTFNDLYWNPGGNKDLKPEQAKLSELGLTYSNQTKKSKLNTELTGFYSLVDDWIIWQQTEFSYWSPSNIRKVENKGIEAIVNYSTLISKYKFVQNLSYAYTSSTNQSSKNENDNSINKQLIYVPFHQFNYNLSIINNGYSINYTFTYTDKRYITTDNNWYLPANFLSDINFGKQLQLKNKTSLSLSIEAKNIFNQDYQSIAWRPMPGRNYLVSLTLSFN
jgi:iron complex outermembrane receptor protein